MAGVNHEKGEGVLAQHARRAKEDPEYRKAHYSVYGIEKEPPTELEDSSKS